MQSDDNAKMISHAMNKVLAKGWRGVVVIMLAFCSLASLTNVPSDNKV
jgi:hypothetical protein